VIIQIDGRAFHTFTRGFKKPFDQVLMAAMRYTAEYLCRNIQGCVLAYTQSDEINLLLIDYEKLETSPWFDNRVQKLASIAASMATNYFNQKFKELVKIICRRYYSPNHSYDRKCNQEIIEMLIQQKDIDWNKLKIYKQRGTCIIRSAHSSFLLNGKQITADTWSHDFDIPRFIGEGRDYIERYLYPDDPNNTTSRKDGNN
jgi:hypothetical protein